MINRKSNTRFRLVPESTTLDDLQGPLRSVSKHVRLSEPTTKIWMKIDPHYQRRRCSPMTLDSDDIKFMRIFAGVPWKGGVICNSGVIENVFSGFRTLRIRHLRKWGHYYYIALFSPLLLFHWPQNAWPWMTLNGLNGHFTFMCSLLRTAAGSLFVAYLLS